MSHSQLNNQATTQNQNVYNQQECDFFGQQQILPLQSPMISTFQTYRILTGLSKHMQSFKLDTKQQLQLYKQSIQKVLEQIITKIQIFTQEKYCEVKRLNDEKQELLFKIAQLESQIRDEQKQKINNHKQIERKIKIFQSKNLVLQQENFNLKYRLKSLDIEYKEEIQQIEKFIKQKVQNEVQIINRIKDNQLQNMIKTKDQIINELKTIIKTLKFQNNQGLRTFDLKSIKSPVQLSKNRHFRNTSPTLQKSLSHKFILKTEQHIPNSKQIFDFSKTKFLAEDFNTQSKFPQYSFKKHIDRQSRHTTSLHDIISIGSFKNLTSPPKSRVDFRSLEQNIFSLSQKLKQQLSSVNMK